ncbi:CocE/NonD family hydrolase [Pseudoduganella sp. SL102]|uniref:CocE/NonD family hydrolase n=1 Tax=Pseudoduganella sp. SL102 TaxID=2995154 RepID=UPI00248B81DA|nr:CocE/NonD family hydrolase [Pseudoduganella sp. SL102]WBS00693.1 CocE/NonD family hydrolase [Pseudoduganella sp. SL102]
MRRSGLAVVLLAVMCAAGTASLAAAVSAPPTPSGAFGKPLPAAQNEVVMSSMYIPMPDGTRMAADIYRPAKDGVALPGPFPVIYHATAARQRMKDADDRSGAGGFSLQMIQLANHGYVYMQVERRGIAASFGVRRGYHDRKEAADSQYLINWAATQPWSNGKVGGFGCSNTGDAAMHFLTMPSPALKAVFAGCFNWDKYSGGLRGGILANWGTGPQGSFEQDMRSTPVDGDGDKVLLAQAAREHAANTDLLDLWSGMPFRDSVSPLTGSRFWEEGSIGTHVDQVRASRVPVYVQGGWNDDFRGQGLIVLENLPQPTKLIIGPWGHCESGDFSMTAEALRFFDYWLKDARNGIMDEPRIHYTTANVRGAPDGHEWRTAEKWPLRPARKTRLYLGAPSRLAPNDHAFGARAPGATAAPITFKVDYEPLPCPHGNRVLGPTCPQDSKGLTFTSPVLEADTEVTGFPVADLWVSATATDGPLFAYLEDVAPDGGITMVSEGRLKASLRKLGKAPYRLPDGMLWPTYLEADARPLVPGRPVRLQFDLMPVSYVFQAGHRYRLTLTGADPREKLRAVRDPAPSWTIYRDTVHASHLVLPIVKGKP